jgi:hypothetical protein
MVWDAPGFETALHVLAATDRTTRTLFIQDSDEANEPGWIVAAARRRHLGCWPSSDPTFWETAAKRARDALARGEIVALPLAGRCATQADKLLGELLNHFNARIVPLHYGRGEGERAGRIYIVAGDPLPALSDAATVRSALDHLRAEFDELSRAEGGLEQALSTAH